MTGHTWRLGDVFVLRHAGFPFDWIESLGLDPYVLDLARRVIAARDRLDGLAGHGDRSIRRRVAAVLDGAKPAADDDPEAAAAVAGWQAARAELDAAYATDHVRVRGRLRHLARDPRIVDAVFLSNPAVHDNVWRRYTAAGEHRDNADWRRMERVAYTYLQRFCAKNETTSFFGPIGYGEVVDGDGFEVRIDLPRTRRVFLAHWAATELARTIRRAPSVRPHLPARLNPAFRIDGRVAIGTPFRAEVALPPAAVGIARALASGADTLAAAGACAGHSADGVMEAARPLLRGNVVTLGPFIAADSPDTLVTLRRAVGRLPACPERTLWMRRLRRLAQMLAEFARSTGGPRRDIFARIERTFTEWTGVAARRGEGQAYADRLVLFEEARSQFALRVGRTGMEALAAALAPGLELSAAFGAGLQRAHRRAMASVVREGECLPFVEYSRRARPDDVTGSQFAAPAHIDLAPGDAAAGEVPTALCDAGTDGARYALPDVCLAAPSVDAIRVGRHEVVTARVHHHLLVWGWLAVFHPDGDRFAAAASAFVARETSDPLIGLTPRRRNKGYYRFPGSRALMPGVTLSDAHPGDLPISDLRVVGGPDGPRLTDPDGRPLQLYLPLADYTTYPPFCALAHPPVLHAPLRTGRAHSGRLRAGGAVYQRARWQLRLGYLADLRGVDLLLAVTRVAQEHGWPRFLFARVASERKPQLIDTASPFGHELLRRLARGDALISLEEMLPGPGDLWLRDDAGRYTCELRMQAVRPACTATTVDGPDRSHVTAGARR